MGKFYESRFSRDGDISIYWRKSISRKDPKCVVIFNHGILEHVELYEYLFDKFTKENIAIYAYDSRGHGRTSGKRGYVDYFNDFVEDLRYFIVNIVTKESNGKPIFILSHSMGSLISMNYLINYSEDSHIRGAVIGSIGSKFNIMAKVLIVLSHLTKKVFPNIWVPVPLFRLFVKGDKELVRKVIKNPYTLRRIYGRIGLELDKGLQNIVENLDKVQVPIFLQYGSRDLLFKKQHVLYDRLTIENKKVVKYNKYGHDIYREKEEYREIVFTHAIDWLNRNV